MNTTVARQPRGRGRQERISPGAWFFRIFDAPPGPLDACEIVGLFLEEPQRSTPGTMTVRHHDAAAADGRRADAERYAAAEAQLRTSEARQAFLLSLQDRLAPL